jgi:hypothetical protein
MQTMLVSTSIVSAFALKVKTDHQCEHILIAIISKPGLDVSSTLLVEVDQRHLIIQHQPNNSGYNFRNEA